MAGKKVSFGTKPQKQPDVDAWVESRDSPIQTSTTEERAVIEEKEPVQEEAIEPSGDEKDSPWIFLNPCTDR